MENSQKENRTGRTSLKKAVYNYLGNLENDDEAKKVYRTTKVINMFKQAIDHVYKDAAFLILQNINAVYILQEREKGQKRHASKDDKLEKRLIIYTCDSMVYADLDSRQEFIKMWFNTHGEHIDKFELVSSKFGMRKRFPYKDEVFEMKKKLEDNDNFEERKIADAQFFNDENLDLLNNKISEIKNPKLQKSLKNLIN